MQRARRRIALLTGALDDRYLMSVLQGVVEAARSTDVDVFAFAGGPFAGEVPRDAVRAGVFDMCRPADFDGFIIMAGLVGRNADRVAFRDYCVRFAPKPICTVAWQLDGASSVLVDNAVGLRAAVRHLVEVNGRLRIAYVRGPKLNEEAELRHEAFRAELTALGLLDDALVVESDFTRAGGAAAAVRLLTRGRRFDALLAANDLMAIGALDELQRQGVVIPDDVAVVGFDDISESRVCVPPMTTVRQPLAEQGRSAVQLVLDAIDGRAVRAVHLPTRLVVRQSCGCLPQQLELGDGESPRSQRPAESATDLLRSLLSTWGSLPGGPRRGPLAELEQAMVGALADARAGDVEGASARFARRCRRLVNRSILGGADLSAWHEHATALGRKLLSSPCTDPEGVRILDGLLQELTFAISDKVGHSQARRRLAYRQLARRLSSAGGALSTSFEESSLVRAVHHQFLGLGVFSHVVTVQELDGDERRSRVLTGHDGRRALGVEHRTYRHDELPFDQLPARRADHLVLPLCFGDTVLGTLVAEPGPWEGFIYEAIRDQLASAVKGMLLIQDIEAREHERRDLVVHLQSWTDELERARREITEHQQRLVVTTKLASVGQLRASFARELHAPLEVLDRALAEQRDLVDDYESAVAGGVDRQRLEAVERAMVATLGGAHRAVDRAIGFVRQVRAQTRDVASDRVVFAVRRVTEEALLLMSYALLRAGVEASLKASADVGCLHGSPERLSQIVTHLVRAALEAVLEAEASGPIEVSLRRDAGSVVLEVGHAGVTAIAVDDPFEPLVGSVPDPQRLALSIVGDVVRGHFGGDVERRVTDGRTAYRVTLASSDGPAASPG